jgi:hypothetical protein
MAFNSTIRTKQGKCSHPGCHYYGPLTKKLCNQHYWESVRIKSASKLESKELDLDELDSVAILKKDADALFSRLIRLRAAEADTGLCICFICDAPILYTDAQAMHYVGRIDSSVRLHPKNVRCGCKNCNEYLNGNLIKYAERLDAEEKDLSEWLYVEGNQPYKFTRDELKQMINDFSREIRLLQKTKNLK